MNKTTLEGLEEALERLEQIDGKYSWAHLLFEVREALAEPVKPKECAKGCPENTVCNYCQRAEPVKQEPEKLIEEIKMKPIAYLIDGELRVEADYAGKIYYSEKPIYDEADIRKDERNKLMSTELTDDDILEANKHSHGNTEWARKKAFSHSLINAFKHKNAAPVDAKAIRAEALEEAAKWCDDYAAECAANENWEAEDVSLINAAAIRGLK